MILQSEYLTIMLKDISEFNIIYKWLTAKKYTFDFFFLINIDKKLNLYISKTDKNVNKLFKEIHHFYYMNINSLYSFKNMSKHSVFLNGLNIFKKSDIQKKYDFNLLHENFIIDLIDK